MIPTVIITAGGFSSSQAFRESAGPVVRAAVAEVGWQTIAEALIPNDQEQIARTLVDFARLDCQLILTIGGIGISIIDGTPEAIRSVARLEIPGFGGMMRRPTAASEQDALFRSRGLGAVVQKTLLVALPAEPPSALAGFHLAANLIALTTGILQGPATDCQGVELLG